MWTYFKIISVLICNLAVADLLFVMTSPVLSVTLFSENFIFGKYICKIFTGWMYTSMYNRNVFKNVTIDDIFMLVTSRCHQHPTSLTSLYGVFWIHKSAFTVTALSIDRFCAVASPLKMRRYRSRSTAFYVTLITWILSFLWIRDDKSWRRRWECDTRCGTVFSSQIACRNSDSKIFNIIHLKLVTLGVF